jgi:hypothetical protein
MPASLLECHYLTVVPRLSIRFRGNNWKFKLQDWLQIISQVRGLLAFGLLLIMISVMLTSSLWNHYLGNSRRFIRQIAKGTSDTFLVCFKLKCKDYARY